MQERGTSGGSQDEGILIGPGPLPGQAAQPEERLGFQTPPPPSPSPPQSLQEAQGRISKTKVPSAPEQGGRGQPESHQAE